MESYFSETAPTRPFSGKPVHGELIDASTNRGELAERIWEEIVQKNDTRGGSDVHDSKARSFRYGLVDCA